MPRRRTPASRVREIPLRPCPFCGTSNLQLTYTLAWVQCNRCGALGPMATPDRNAAEAWNTRTPKEAHT